MLRTKKRKLDIVPAITDSGAVPVDENSPSTRIIDGELARDNQFPYVVIKYFNCLRNDAEARLNDIIL